MNIQEFENRIINGDTLEILKEMPDNSIDMIITSPPYNVGMKYQITDDRQKYSNYLEYMENIIKECYRILIKGGRIAWNCPSSIMQSTKSRMAYLSIDFILMMRKAGFLDREILTWIKMPCGEIPGHSTSWGSWLSPSLPYLRDASEFIVVMDKETHKKEGNKKDIDITTNEFLKFTANVWYMRPELDREHPAPFPEELPYRLIKLYSYQNDIILDPFVGSGTTCFVASKLKRRYIGIDLNKKYCEWSEQRINNERNQLKLDFIERLNRPRIKEEQQKLFKK